jgi:hypothetical protein
MNNPTSLKKSGLALGIALALAAGSAAATTYTLPTTGAPIGSLVGSSFADIFNINLATPSNIAGIGQSVSMTFSFPPPFGTVVLPPVSFSSVSLLDSGNNTIWSSTPNASSFSFTGSSLAAGIYHLNVSGTASGYGGGYAVSLMAAPVPEPGEWAMMLAGLGIVGIMARRRSLKG